jgi:hypothetical protein
MHKLISDRRRRFARRRHRRAGRKPGDLHIRAAGSWLSMGALQTKVEAQGYSVRKAKLKAACGELYTVDKDGNRVELFVDPTSGEIVGKL